MSLPPPASGWRRALPAWVVGYRSPWLRDDIIAGFTLAVMLVPQAMAYASLAGMPPITGLYAATVALLVYALLGTSSHLSFGPFALVALLSAAAVEPLAGGQPARYVALSGMLAIMVGVIHLLLAVARAGAIVDLISHPVIVGFTAAVGLVIGLSQLPDLTGSGAERSERFLDAVTAAVEALPHTHTPTLVIGAAALAVLVLGRRLKPRLPAALLVVVTGIAATLVFELTTRGVAVVGAIPPGLPLPRIPFTALDDVRALLPSALVLAVICFAGNMTMARSVPARTRERLDTRRELVASGAANLASGVVSGFPVSASFTRTVVVWQAGARTQLAGVVAAVSLVVTLVVATPLLEPLPRAVLAAIVVVAVAGLIDVRSARAIVQVDRADAAVMLVTFAATLGLGVEQGLLTGVLTNLAVHVVKRMHPSVIVLGRVEGATIYRNVGRYPTVTDPNGVIVRLDGALDFLSVDRVTGRIRDLVTSRPALSWVVLVASGVTELDTTGIRGLHDLRDELAGASIELHLAALRGDQRDAIERAGLWSELGEGSCHPDVPAALRSAGVRADAPILVPQTGELPPARLL